MFNFGHFIFGIVSVVIGVVFVKFTYQIVGFTGRQDWIERYLGSGSTYLAYKLFAIALILFGIVYGLGLVHPHLANPFAGVKN